MEKRPDYYIENGSCVFTAGYLLERGYCCEKGCRHCPYGFRSKTLREKVTISWSGGKDSVLALHKIVSAKTLDVVSLHTVIDESTKRVGLHGVSEELIERQSQSIGIPLEKIYLPASNDKATYAETMHQFYHRSSTEGISGVVFGDIFLEDLKEYRLTLLKPSGMYAAFPQWAIINKGMEFTIFSAWINMRLQ